MNKFGFTGTRQGPSTLQRDAFERYVAETPIDMFYNGLCVGWDAVAVAIVRKIHRTASIIGYPSDIESMISKTAAALCDIVHDPLPPLDRNKKIVSSCTKLLVCPLEMDRRQRGGTWHTLRYAEQTNCPTVIFWRDGSVS
jgi:hypothetical protein